MEIIGFLAVCLLALGATVMPILVIILGLSPFGSEMGKKDWAYCIFIWFLAGLTWYYAYNNAPFSITLN